MSIRRLLLSCLLILPVVSAASDAMVVPPAGDLIRVSSVHDVNTTMDRFEKLVTSKGLAVIARVNHQAAANKVGLELSPAQVLIFGNPTLGTPLLQENPASGLDLPLRVAVYADQDGKTQMVYHNPLNLAASYQLNNEKTLNKMAAALKALTGKASQE